MTKLYTVYVTKWNGESISPKEKIDRPLSMDQVHSLLDMGDVDSTLIIKHTHDRIGLENFGLEVK